MSGGYLGRTLSSLWRWALLKLLRFTTYKIMARIAIFLKAQNPNTDAAVHRASATLGGGIVLRGWAKWLTEEKRAIQLLVSDSWTQVKLRYRAAPVLKADIGLLAPLDFYPVFMTSYPPTPQTFREREVQRDLWMRAESF